MNGEKIVAFDVDGVLGKGTTLKSDYLLLSGKFSNELEGVSGEYSKKEDMKETAGPIARVLQALEYRRHRKRSMNTETLQVIKEFKESEAKKKGSKTKLIVVSGRSKRMTELTMSKVKEAGFEGLFDGYFLREPGYSSPGWKLHQSNVFPDANIYCQIDDDPLAGCSVLKSQVPNREKHAFIIKGWATNPQLLALSRVEFPSNLYVVGSVAQALAAIANLTAIS